MFQSVCWWGYRVLDEILFPLREPFSISEIFLTRGTAHTLSCSSKFGMWLSGSQSSSMVCSLLQGCTMVDKHSHIELYEPKCDGDWADFSSLHPKAFSSKYPCSKRKIKNLQTMSSIDDGLAVFGRFSHMDDKLLHNFQKKTGFRQKKQLFDTFCLYFWGL